MAIRNEQAERPYIQRYEVKCLGEGKGFDVIIYNITYGNRNANDITDFPISFYVEDSAFNVAGFTISSSKNLPFKAHIDWRANNVIFYVVDKRNLRSSPISYEFKDSCKCADIEILKTDVNNEGLNVYYRIFTSDVTLHSAFITITYTYKGMIFSSGGTHIVFRTPYEDFFDTLSEVPPNGVYDVIIRIERRDGTVCFIKKELTISNQTVEYNCNTGLITGISNFLIYALKNGSYTLVGQFSNKDFPIFLLHAIKQGEPLKYKLVDNNTSKEYFFEAPCCEITAITEFNSKSESLSIYYINNFSNKKILLRVSRTDISSHYTKWDVVYEKYKTDTTFSDFINIERCFVYQFIILDVEYMKKSYKNSESPICYANKFSLEFSSPQFIFSQRQSSEAGELDISQLTKFQNHYAQPSKISIAKGLSGGKRFFLIDIRKEVYFNVCDHTAYVDITNPCTDKKVTISVTGSTLFVWKHILYCDICDLFEGSGNLIINNYRFVYPNGQTETIPDEDIFSLEYLKEISNC